MNSKGKVLVTVFVVVSLFLTITPMVSSKPTPPTWYEDLTVEWIDVVHENLNTEHTAFVCIKNIGTFPVSETFTLALYFEIDCYQGVGFESFQKVKEWDIAGLEAGEGTIRFHMVEWDNPDPMKYQARFYAYVDSDFEVSEWEEYNNDLYSDFFY
jgi:hypothetical protein